MKSHQGENWPYHESAKGDMVPCASNPCKIHGGSDIIATSPEEAYERKYESTSSQGMSDEAVMDDNEVKRQQDKLNSRLQAYAPAGWNGLHLEDINGGQYNSWQGYDYQRINKHLDIIEHDDKMDDKTKEQYYAYVAGIVSKDGKSISLNNTSSYPVRFLLDDDVEQHASSFSIQSTEGFFDDTSSILHHGIAPKSVRSMRSLNMMFGKPDTMVSMDTASSISTSEWGGTGEHIIVDASQKNWGEFAMDESLMNARELPVSYNDESRKRAALERVREWGLAAKSSDGYADYISNRSWQSFGRENGDVIRHAMLPNYYNNAKSAQVDDRDIRAIARTQPKRLFALYSVGTNASMQQRDRALKTKDRRCRALIRCTSIADRLHVPVSRVYNALLDDSKNGGHAIHDVMNGNADAGSQVVARIFDNNR
jgi:hypothetical protein